MFGKLYRPAGCEHAAHGEWHVPRIDAARMFRTEAPRQHTLFDQLKLEVGSSHGFWTWLAIAFMISYGVILENWLVVGIFVFVAGFLACLMPGIIRKVRDGTTALVTCREVKLKRTYGGLTMWDAFVDFQGERRQFAVMCPHFERLVREVGAVECEVVVLAGSTSLDLLAFRVPEGTELPAAPLANNVPEDGPNASRLVLSFLASLGLGLLGAASVAWLSYRLGFQFEFWAIGVGLLAGRGAAIGGNSAVTKLVAGASSVLGFLFGFSYVVYLHAGQQVVDLKALFELSTIHVFSHASIAIFVVATVLVSIGTVRSK